MTDFTGIATVITSVATLVTALASWRKTSIVSEKADSLHDKQDVLQKQINGALDKTITEARKVGALEALTPSDIDEPTDEHNSTIVNRMG